MIINGRKMDIEEVIYMLYTGTQEAKYEIMVQMFEDMDEEFIKNFRDSLGADKFNKLVVLC